MLKAQIVIQVVDGDKTYNVGDKVKVSMKALTGQANGDEHIGKIADIQETFMVLDTTIVKALQDYVVVNFGSVEKMKLV